MLIGFITLANQQINESYVRIIFIINVISSQLSASCIHPQFAQVILKLACPSSQLTR